MKVLIINSVCGIRSTGRIATDIAEEYMTKGHECKIAYGRETVPELYKKISYRIGTECDIKFNALKVRIFDNEGFNAAKATKSFLKWANNYNPDLLWLHNLHGYYINIELLFEWIKSRPQMQVKWTLHDCWAFTGHCAHFTLARCDRWHVACGMCPQVRKYPKSLFYDASAKNFQRKKQAFCGVTNMSLITPSYWLADLVRESYLKEYSVEVRHNTIDQEAFIPIQSDFRERLGLINKRIVLGVASAWGKEKGFNDFFKLADLLDDEYVIVLVGCDNKQQKMGTNSVVCLPRTNSVRELVEIYSAADVFINLTYEDTFPTVNLESQACGTPCLTYRTGGSVESVKPENIVEQGDILAMATLIKKVCVNK